MKNLMGILALLASSVLTAQQKNQEMPLGNRDYSEKKYTEAEARYRSAASNSEDGKANLNMGNAIYREKNPTEAGGAYLKAIEKAKTHDEKHRAYHNLGNVMMKAKDYQGAVEAYRNALRGNPNDEQTRYNFALAKKYLKDNPPPKDKGKDKKKEEDDKNDEKKKQDQKDKKDQDKKDQKDGQQQPKEGQKPQPKPQNGMSQQRMQNLLDAVNNEEKKVQQKVNGKKVQGRPVENGKDW